MTLRVYEYLFDGTREKLRAQLNERREHTRPQADIGAVVDLDKRRKSG